MKKIIAVILAVVIVACVFAACSSGNQTTEVPVQQETVSEGPAETVQDEQPEEVAAPEYDPLVFVSGNVTIDIMDNADEITAALGDPISSFEADSCAFQGKDLFLYYDGFQLTVNEVGGENKITAVTLVDDTVAMPDGIKIGSPEEDIAAIYGDDFRQDGSIYVFSGVARDGGEKQLRIKAENGSVSAVELVYATEGNEE